MTGFSCKLHRNTLGNSKVQPIRRLERRTKTHPILETFIFFITTQRFGGIAAQEGREKVPDHIFPQIKKLCFSNGRLWNQPNFPQKCVSGGSFWNQPNFPAKFVKTGWLTCDFLGDLEGKPWLLRRPVDRCNEILLAGGFLACERRSEGRSFHVFCRKIWIIPPAFDGDADSTLFHFRRLLVRSIYRCSLICKVPCT
jgi:hypothetical protein